MAFMMDLEHYLQSKRSVSEGTFPGIFQLPEQTSDSLICWRIQAKKDEWSLAQSITDLQKIRNVEVAPACLDIGDPSARSPQGPAKAVLRPAAALAGLLDSLTERSSPFLWILVNLTLQPVCVEYIPGGQRWASS